MDIFLVYIHILYSIMQYCVIFVFFELRVVFWYVFWIYKWLIVILYILVVCIHSFIFICSLLFCFFVF